MTPDPSAPHVLVVDDNPELLELLAEHLRGTGFTVSVAEDGAAALELLERVSVDVILSDIQMPTVNGLDLLRHVKAKWSTVEFILMTGYASVDSAVAAVNLGAHSYIRKPFKLQEVDDALASALGIRRRNRQKLELLTDLRERIEKLRSAHLVLKDEQEHMMRAERIRVFAETLGGFNHEMNNLAMSITAAVGCARRALDEGRRADVARDLAVVEEQALSIAQLLEDADTLEEVTSTDYVAGIRMLDLRGESVEKPGLGDPSDD